PDGSLLLDLTGRLNINGPNSTNKIVINDSQNARSATAYTIDETSVTRRARSLPLLFTFAVTISYSTGFGNSVELDTAKGGATIHDNGSNIFMDVVAGSGVDTLTGPNLINSWGVTGLNQGTLPNLAFRGVENLVGGTNNDTFRFSDGARV